MPLQYTLIGGGTMRLKELRESHGLTLTELAYLIGVTPSYISKLERGTRNPSLRVLQKLADLFGCTIDEIVEPTKGGHEHENLVTFQT